MLTETAPPERLYVSTRKKTPLWPHFRIAITTRSLPPPFGFPHSSSSSSNERGKDRQHLHYQTVKHSGKHQPLLLMPCGGGGGIALQHNGRHGDVFVCCVYMLILRSGTGVGSCVVKASTRFYIAT